MALLESAIDMSDWMAAGAGVLHPLWQVLKRHVLLSKVLHTDDTTVPVRDESRTTLRYGRLWNYIGDADHPGIVFDYTASHARDGPAAFLKDFKGFLQADAYGAYDGIYTGSNGAIVEVGCWAHARNKFADAEATDPERSLAAKAWVRKLYDVEDEAKELSSAERLRLRQEKSVPLLHSLHRPPRRPAGFPCDHLPASRYRLGEHRVTGSNRPTGPHR